MSRASAGLAPPDFAIELARAVDGAGGRLLMVGGWVRDRALGRESKDVDFECHGLDADRLRRVLRRFGHVKAVGKSFGVFKLRIDGEEIDVALPRGDALPSGEIGVSGDPDMGITEACRRRDLTINALMYDPLRDEILDPFGGLSDIDACLLREVDPRTFLQDPHRALRAVRFAVTLGFEISPSLHEVCRQAELSTVPEERLRVELEKILLRSMSPGRAAALLDSMGLMAPIAPGLVGTDEGWRAALDRAAATALEDPSSRYVLMFAAWLSPLSPEDAEGWLDRYRIRRVQKRLVRKQIVVLLRQLPEALSGPGDAALRRLADGGAEVALLLLLADAIAPSAGAAERLARARLLGVDTAPLPGLISGADLAALGAPRGPAYGQILAAVREAQYRGEVMDRVEALEAARALIATNQDA